MKNLRKGIEDKLDPKELQLERYFEFLYKDSFTKPLKATFTKEQSFLQVPLSEAKFLEMLVRVKNPKNILEIGTFRGFSTVFLAKHCKGKVTTIERDKNRYEDIEALFKKTKVDKQITLMKDFAKPALESLFLKNKRFDLFFIDAAKKETLEYFKFCFDKLANKGAVVVVDNTLWAGEVAKDEPTSNSAKAMKSFNEFVFKKCKKDAYILPGWDGVTIIIKD